MKIYKVIIGLILFFTVALQAQEQLDLLDQAELIYPAQFYLDFGPVLGSISSSMSFDSELGSYFGLGYERYMKLGILF